MIGDPTSFICAAALGFASGMCAAVAVKKADGFFGIVSFGFGLLVAVIASNLRGS